MCVKASKLKGLIVQIDSGMVYKDVNAIVSYLYITSSLEKY